MGGRPLIPPPVVKFPVPRPLGDILQKWARLAPKRLKQLEKLVRFVDDTAEPEEIDDPDPRR